MVILEFVLRALVDVLLPSSDVAVSDLQWPSSLIISKVNADKCVKCDLIKTSLNTYA